MDITSEHEMRDWVSGHRVSWEVMPLVERQRGSCIRVGFELLLTAQDTVRAPCTPACPRCRELYEGLRGVARLVLQPDRGQTRCDVLPFDAAYHLRPETGWVPEVQLVIQIFHRQGYFTAVGESERACLAEIEARLRRLGAHLGPWRRTAQSPNEETPRVA